MAIASAPQELPRGRPGTDGAAARSEELYRRYARTVGGLCRALLRDAAEAEDATQQTFLSAHRALRNGVEPREPAAWLATIARNECRSRSRSRMREPLPTDDVEAAAGASDPVVEAIRRADLAALWQAIDALPRPQRDALLLREFGGLSYDELAAALAVSGPAVESLLFRARSRLRARLRTTYAALAGASWLDTIARAAASALGGGPAPVAAKAVAVGLGAAAVTGGAVVVPHVLDHPRAVHHHAAPHRAAPTGRPVRVDSVTPPSVAPPAPTRSRTVETERSERRRGDGRGRGRDEQRGRNGEDGGGSSRRGSSGEGPSGGGPSGEGPSGEGPAGEGSSRGGPGDSGGSGDADGHGGGGGDGDSGSGGK